MKFLRRTALPSILFVFMCMSSFFQIVKAEELRIGYVNTEKIFNESREAVTSKGNKDETQKFTNKANSVIKKIAEQNKFDFIFQKAVYINPRLDITKTVLSGLDESSVNFAISTFKPTQSENELSKAKAEAEEAKKLLAEAEEIQRSKLQMAEQRQRELEEQIKIAQQQTSAIISQSAIGITKERRIALVIGNATYKVNPLKNPVNDSTDMARSLRSVGFDVIEANNTTLTQMREVTRRFADKLGNSDVGLVYYSGHGVEVKGKNYLIPVNADIKREYEVVDQAFDASQFLEMMDNIRGPNNKRVNILIVDACRNNELQKSWRSTNNGLARMDAPGGTFISFATAPGRVAADGVGRNSPYTKHLLQALKQPNVPIEQVFKVVRRNVMEETKGEQIPWENSSLVGDFYFTVQR
jgi:Skp family chaperone for outer membrane proteins